MNKILKRFDVYEPISRAFCNGKYYELKPGGAIRIEDATDMRRIETYIAEPRIINLKEK